MKLLNTGVVSVHAAGLLGTEAILAGTGVSVSTQKHTAFFFYPMTEQRVELSLLQNKDSRRAASPSPGQ